MKKKVFKILMLLFLSAIFFGCGIKVEDVEARMEEALYDDYGEEFVVTNIGLREANGQKFYQARIYPEAIIGTEKEGDSYYYAEATIDLVSPNKLANDVGHSYGTIKMNDEVEEFLSPKAKELFGERIRLKTNVEYKEHIGQGYYIRYLESGLEEKRKAIEEDPENKRLEIELYVYIFDRIETDEELESRRVEVFEFLEYIREKKLDKFLKAFITFSDEIVLASSFYENKWNLENSKTSLKIQIENNLREEVLKTSENHLILNMNKIKKSNLSNIRGKYLHGYNQGSFLLLTMEMLKIDEYGRYEDAKENKTIHKHLYKTKDDIEYINYDYYMFETQGGEK